MQILYFITIFLISFSINCKNLYIEKIEIKGLKTANPEFVINEIEKEYDKEKEILTPDELFKGLTEVKLFDYIKIDVINKKLFIEVIEKPYIRSVKLKNKDDKKDEDFTEIFETCKIAPGELFDITNNRLLKSLLEQHYAEMGFFNCKIKTKLKINKELNFIDIEILISKNKQISIKKFILIGNESFSKKDILKYMSFKRKKISSFFKKEQLYTKTKIRTDLLRLKQFYMDKGFANFQIKSAKVYLNKKDEGVLIIDMLEGGLYTHGKIILEGGKFIEPLRTDLVTSLKGYMNEGDLFCLEKIEQLEELLNDFFNDLGYLNVKISHKIANVEYNVMNVLFDCQLNLKMNMRALIFKGHENTSERFLRGCVPQKQGELVSAEAVNDGRQEIAKREVCDAIGATYIATKRAKELDIIIRMIEKRAIKATATVSYSKEEELTLNVIGEFSNLFGEGNDLSFTYTRSLTQTEIGVSYIRSRVLDSDFDLNINVYRRFEDFDFNLTYFDYTANALGFMTDIQFYLSEEEQINLGFGADWLDIQVNHERNPKEVEVFLLKAGEQIKDYYFILAFTRNNLDRIVFPTEGTQEFFNFKIALPISPIKYIQTSYEISEYFRVDEENVVGLFFNAVYGTPMKKNIFPFYKHFLLNGQTGVRGFRDKTIGPRDSNNENIGGNIMMCGKASLYFPFPFLENFETIRTGIFIDAGQVFDTAIIKGSKKKKNKNLYQTAFFKISAGFSLVYQTPFGVPLEFSAAYPLNAQSADKIKYVSFTFGNQ